jgi:hypothetical protein
MGLLLQVVSAAAQQRRPCRWEGPSSADAEEVVPPTYTQRLLEELAAMEDDYVAVLEASQITERFQRGT